MPIALTPVQSVEGANLLVNHVLGFGGVFLLDFTGNYTTGGEVLTAPKTIKQMLRGVGNGNLYYVAIQVKAGYHFEYDYVNDKILVKQGGAAVSNPEAEIAGAAAYPAALTSLVGANRVRGFFLGR